MKKLKSKYNVIGILSFWCTECAFIGNWFGRFNKIKHFAWISGQDAKKDNGYVKFMRPRPDELIAMSDFLQREFLKNHKIKPAYVIPIGIEPAQFPSIEVEKDIHLMGAGSLIPLKKFDVFVSVVKRILNQVPDVRSYLCGDGPEMHELRDMIRKLDLNGQLVLTGKQDHGEVLKMMRRTKVFLHTSSYEGFGAVCIEALYAGAHVISFSRPISGWIRHWHIVKNEDEMCAKAVELLLDPSTFFGPSVPFLMKDTAKKIVGLYLAGPDNRHIQ